MFVSKKEKYKYLMTEEDLISYLVDIIFLYILLNILS